MAAKPENTELDLSSNQEFHLELTYKITSPDPAHVTSMAVPQELAVTDPSAPLGLLPSQNLSRLTSSSSPQEI